VPDHTLTIDYLEALQQKPAPFTPGEPLFWDDPHISKGMLAAHLDPNTEAASRPPTIIDRSVAWIIETLDLQRGDAVLDLGCGPGLYAARFAGSGMLVTGVDASLRSIEYAIEYAKTHHLDVTYRYQDYLTLKDEARYDAALLIYGDLCPLSPSERTQLLRNVHRALKPEGYFVLDVSQRGPWSAEEVGTSWYAAGSGFWRPGPHLVLEQRFDYPDSALRLDQYLVMEADSVGRPVAPTIYRVWRQEYTPETLTAEMEAHGFRVESLWGNLTGEAYDPDAAWIGAVTKRV
jgi:SAM-dependent methyltransferase